MNQEQRQRLQNNLVDTQRYLTETKDKKKAMTSSLNKDIKGSEDRINALVEALDLNDWDPLSPIFGAEEVKFFETGVKY